MPSAQTGLSTDNSTDRRSGQLPRLLYVGDVPVESSYHGSALLYRLLQDYPPDRLLIIETENLRSLPGRRLQDVNYLEVPAGNTRWLKTRFSRLAASALTFRASARVQRLRGALAGFRPQAVLTVAHGYSWLTAARFASEAQIPLHLIVHDDYPTMTPVLSGLQQWQERKFSRVYRQSATRFCVSPFMEEEYRNRYGVAGNVLYPSRARTGSAHIHTPATYARKTNQLVGAYAGNIISREFASPIAILAEQLARKGGKLLLFAPHSADSLPALGLSGRNIVPQGLIDSDQLIRRLREEADFVFVPMALDSITVQARLSFPSKLTDYTATGLPIVICGPEYCSAVRWAREHSPVAEIITSRDPEDFDMALRRLESPGHREALGKAAMTLGNRLFSHKAASDALHGALLSVS
jgi:hypothetical protein